MEWRLNDKGEIIETHGDVMKALHRVKKSGKTNREEPPKPHIEPCFVCGGEGRHWENDYGYWECGCLKCHIAAWCDSFDEHEAIDTWNELSRKLHTPL